MTKLFEELIKQYEQKEYEKVETRCIVLKNSQIDNTYIITNAPSKEIENSIKFQNKYRREDDNWDNDFDSDIAIMEEYMKQHGYTFDDLFAEEEYYW